MDLYDQCFELTMGHEGGELDLSPHDPGNWYQGQLIGSRWGISAATYFPKVDPRTVTREQAEVIYKPDYWLKAAAISRRCHWLMSCSTLR